MEFWAGTEDLSVDFPGFGNAKFKVVRPSYYPIRGGKDNEVMNALNWEVFQMYEMLTKVPVPIREYISLADSVKRQLAVEVADIVSGDLPNRLQYWAELYADREAVIAILKALEKNEYAEMVKKNCSKFVKIVSNKYSCERVSRGVNSERIIRTRSGCTGICLSDT